MYAVIKTGGKQYRVQAGDLLVVEKLDGGPGAQVAFDQVLMIGEGAEVTVGAPIIAGASVAGTLVETRKGEKIKVFKKIRRQGYRRTRGHRQLHSVVRVTSIAGDGKSETWDGTVDLTPLATLNARARNLARGMETSEARRAAKADAKATPAKGEAKAVKTPGAKAAKTAEAKAAPKVKATAPKAKTPAARKAAPKTETPPAKATAKKAPPKAAKSEAAPAKATAKKSQPKDAKPAKPAKAAAKKD